MDDNDLKTIEGIIGYEFNNSDLLQQAFVRKSYSSENGGENNEVLEFIGDKVLDLVVVKLLAEKYGYVKEKSKYNEYKNKFNEGTLTKKKTMLVESKTLANQITKFHLQDYLILGNSDINQNVQEEQSVKEDLFEAIIGAVAIDSDWNMKDLDDVVETLLEPMMYLDMKFYGEDEDYTGLIQEWSQKMNKNVPDYSFFDLRDKNNYLYGNNPINCYSFNNKVALKLEDDEYSPDKDKFTCILELEDIDDYCFKGLGSSKSQARFNACHCAYIYLYNNNLLYTIKDEIDNPNINESINQLETLARRGYFSIPTYDFFENYDNNGNPVWKCECHIEELKFYYWSTSSSKKDAKKSAAYEMLKYVLSGKAEYYEEQNDDYYDEEEDYD